VKWKKSKLKKIIIPRIICTPLSKEENMINLATRAARTMKKNMMKYWDFQKVSLIIACCQTLRKKETQHFLSPKTFLATIIKKTG